MLTQSKPISQTIRQLRVAFPQQDLPVGQDAEWCVVSDGGSWKEFRFHDYAQIYKVPGLYEKIFLDHLKSRSHVVMAEALARELQQRSPDLEHWRVLDLGAGNGHVGSQLHQLGVARLWGVDVLAEAQEAAQRQHPHVYAGYSLVAADLLNTVQSFAPNALICVAALGFGDIDPGLFESIVSGMPSGSIVAFNIKEQFLNALDPSGFNNLFARLTYQGRLKPLRQWRHFHRLSTWGDPLYYLGVVAECL